uniref:F-box/FBD/LRR-repeat protein At3g26920-like n=1 Tax=Erigeron canadensis TaxID=72917 RepID=UPI001CB8E8BD
YVKKGCGGSSSRDHISNIPYDVLYMILYLLPLKELVATSSLSTQWRYIWCKLAKLVFDGTEMLGNMAKDPKSRASDREKYVAMVNNVIENHDYPVILEFGIHFDLDNKYEEHIDEWLRFAVKKKVQILELDMTKIGRKVGCHENYSFPRMLSDPEEEEPIEYAWLNTVRIPFLKKLILKSVDICDGVLPQILDNSPNLETLSLHGVGKLSWVQFGGKGGIRLKHIEIVSCLSVTFVHLFRFDLESFVYKGRAKTVRLISLPLQALDIGNGLAWMENRNFRKLRDSLPFIQVFSINIIFPKKSMELGIVPELPNVKKLRLTIEACRDECLLEFTKLAKACPSLETLTIELRWDSRMKMRWDSVRRVASTPHDQLKTFEIVGYYGRISDFELVVHIIENAARLEKILIDTRHHSEKGTTAVKKEEAERSFAMRRRQQLESITLRDGVDLVIL